MHTVKTRIVVTVLMGGLFSSGIWAQQEYVSPTDGVLLPSPSVTEVNDATAVATNPANLGFLDAWSLMYVGASVNGNSHLFGQGHGLFLAAPMGPFALGVGTELLLPSSVSMRHQGLDKRGRFSVAASFNPLRSVGVGMAYRRLFKYDFGKTVRALDLSVSLRPANFMAVTFGMSDVNTPEIGYGQITRDGIELPGRTEDAPKRLSLALTIRPFGTDRVSVGTEVRRIYGERQIFDLARWDYDSVEFYRTDAMGLLSISLMDGLSLRTRFGAEGLQNDSIQNAYFLDAAISVNSARFPFGISASPYYKLHPDTDNGFEGISFAVGIGGAESSSMPLLFSPAYVVPLEIDGTLDSYEFAVLMAQVERIRHDKSVNMVLYTADADTLSLTEAFELRRQFLALAERGISTVCYIEEADVPAYVACAAADEVWLNPAGNIRMAGLSTRAVYFKELMDKAGVTADIVKIGEYKSAPEAVTRTGPSSDAARAMNRYLDSVYEAVVSAISDDRGFSDRAVTRRVVESGPFVGTEALNALLVDKLVSLDSLEDELERANGMPVYLEKRYGERQMERRRYLDTPQVAVVHIQGDITTGESRDIPGLNIRRTGAKTVVEQLRQLKEDPRVSAVMLRIDSPGGSAVAADIIWREVRRLQEHKPVVASLGSVAASGAYYIASAARIVFAESTSLTGSIGVYYGKADISGLLNKIGVSTTTFARGPHADMQSWTRGYTDEEREKLSAQLQQYYQLFLERVVEGRDNGYTVDMLDKRARGRVWSGTDARYHLLVDRIGGYQEALRHARGLGGVNWDTPLMHLPGPRRSLVDLVMRSVEMKQGKEDSLMFIPASMMAALKAAVPFSLADSHSPQSRLPFSIIDIR